MEGDPFPAHLVETVRRDQRGHGSSLRPPNTASCTIFADRPRDCRPPAKGATAGSGRSGKQWSQASALCQSKPESRPADALLIQSLSLSQRNVSPSNDMMGAAALRNLRTTNSQAGGAQFVQILHELVEVDELDHFTGSAPRDQAGLTGVARQ